MIDNVKKYYRQVINAVTIITWIYAIFVSWVYLNESSWVYQHLGLVLFFMLCLQAVAYCDFKQILTLKDKEAIFLLLIFIATVCSMKMTNSAMGGALLIFDFCLIWYLSTRWSWSQISIKIIWIYFIAVFCRWIFFPKFQNFNTNSIGLITLIAGFCVIGGLIEFYSDKKWCALVQLIILLLSVVQIVRFKGRGSLVGWGVFIVLRYLIPKTWWKKSKFCMLIYAAWTAGSLAFVSAYIWLSSFVSDYTVAGKRLFTSREKIWEELWKAFIESPITGTGNNISLESWSAVNVHNSIYNILIVYGVGVFILAMVYLLWKYSSICKTMINKKLFIMVLPGITAVFIESYFETTLLWPETTLTWMFLVLLLSSGRNLPQKNPDLDKEL